MEFEAIATLVNRKVLERQGRPLKDVERLVLKGAWENQTYATIATEAVGYTEDYLKKDVGPKLWRLLSEVVTADQPGMKVTKRNIQNVLQTWAGQRLEEPVVAPIPVASPEELPTAMVPGLRVQSHPPLDTADFCDRQTDLTTLTQWIMADRCRLVVLWGLTGVGKTTLVAQLMAQLRSQLDRVGYLALGQRSTDTQVITALTTWLAPPPGGDNPGTLDWLIDQFQQHRCLLLLDNLEHGFAPGHMAGLYRSGAEGLQGLLQRVAEGQHQSCLVVVSQERPADLPQLLGGRVRDYHLEDFGPDGVPAYLTTTGALHGRDEDWQGLIQRYGGNPLLLRSLGATVKTVYQGKIQPFLADEPFFLPTAIQQRLNQLFERLIPEEQSLLYWLALTPEPLPLTEVIAAAIDPIGAEAVQSLLGRALCHGVWGDDGSAMVLDLNPMVRMWGLDHLRSRLETELTTEQLHWFCRCPLVTVTAREVVQERQRLALVQPLGAVLAQHQAPGSGLATKVQRLLHQLTKAPPGYGVGNLIHLCQGLNVSLSGVNFSHLTIWQGDLRQVNLQGANFSQAHFKDTVFATALGRCPVAAFSGDHPAASTAPPYLATGDHEGRLLLWERGRGRLLRVLDDGLSLAIHALAFSPQGDLLAVGTETGQIWLWPLQTTYQGDGLFDHQVAVRALAFSPDGRQLASGDDSGRICLWDLASGLVQGALLGHSGPIHSLAFNPTGTQLVSGGDDQRACLWDVAQGKLVRPFQARTTAWICTAGFLADAAAPTQPPIPFAAGHDEQCLTIWNLETGRPCWTLPSQMQATTAMALSPDGRYLGCSYPDFTVALWDIPRRALCHGLPSLGSPVWTLAFSDDSRYLVTGSDYTIKLWSAETGHGLRSLISQAHPLRAVAYGADKVLTGHDDGPLRLWETATATLGFSGPKLLRGHGETVGAVALSDDGAWAASSGSDRTLRLWQTASGACEWLLSTAPATVLGFSTRSQWLAYASDDPSISVWQVATGQLVAHWDNPQGIPVTLAFSPDGQSLYWGCRDGSLWRGTLTSPTAPQPLPGHQGPVHSLSLSLDGTVLASASHDGTLRWWDVTSGRQLGQWLLPEGHWLHGVTIDHQGQVLAIVSHGLELAIWAVQSNRCQYRLKGHSQDVWQVQVSCDRTLLISASQDDEIRLWSLDQGTCQQTLRPNRPYEGVNIWGATGLSEPEIAMLKALGATERF
jgi:WD40 repeat protein